MVNEVARPVSTRPRGRPRLRSDEEILEAALRAFAVAGYEAMSVRSLSTGLGLSHDAVGRRFGSKQDLYVATLDFGFERLNASIAAASQPPSTDLDDVGRLREILRTFMIAAADHPDLGRLINQEALTPSARLDYIVVSAVEPGVQALIEVVTRLIDAGRIRRTTARELFFLAQAGAAPFTQTGLSRAFDVVDGPFDPTGHVDQVADLIVAGLLVHREHRN